MYVNYPNMTLQQGNARVNQVAPTPGSMTERLQSILGELGRAHVHYDQVSEKLTGPRPEASNERQFESGIVALIERIADSAQSLANRIETLNGAL